MKFRSLISLIVSKINSDSKGLADKKISPMGLKLVLWYNAVRKDFFIQTYNSVGQSKILQYVICRNKDAEKDVLT